MRSYILVLVIFCLPAVFATAATPVMSKYEHANLLKAIEDYRFNEFEGATKTLESLHIRFPKNLRVIHYLGLVYQEGKHYQKSIDMFNLWLENAKNTSSEKSRFAWMGIARSQIGLHDYWEAVRNIKTWLKKQPNDTQAYLMLGDVLLRAESFAQADDVFQTILDNQGVRRTQHAAAWYYKAWSAFLQSEMKAMKHYVTRSLALDAEGAYARPARNLLLTPAPKKLGSLASLSVETFYNSNVELLPDIIQSTGGESDFALRSDVMLGWATRKLDLNYAFSGTFYQVRTDFNLLVHTLSATWSEKKWAFIPTYEYISLDDNFLYQGYGLGVRYRHQNWAYQYTGKVKVFSDAYGSNAVNLARLGGSSHVLSVQKGLNIQGIYTVLSSEASSELTIGDATHNQTDSYIQLSGRVVAEIPLTDAVSSQLSLKIYIREYSAADTAALMNNADTTIRSDVFTQLSTTTTWQPWGDEGGELVLNLAYQTNNSNYDAGVVANELSKSYASWKAGVVYAGQW